jgi:ribosome-associated toxin RatA of RatAB toxin-antitoxin module
MMSLNPKVKEEYLKLLCMIPINVLNSQYQDNPASLHQTDFNIFSSLVRINYTSSSLETNISVNNFKAIMGYMLAGLEQHNETLYSKTWLERLYFASKHNINYNLDNTNEDNNSNINNKSNASLVTLDSVIESHDGLLWFWALWECAQFCIQSKLKTPLGKAQDTFVAIENAIKLYYHNSQSTSSTKNVSFDLTQVTLLLHFVEYLEKIIYNASEGTADSLHTVQKAVKIFFRTNKNTCNEWFWRVRYSLISICIKNSHYEIGVRHCYEFIQFSMQHQLTISQEFDQVIVWLVESFIKLRSWQSIIGLYEWLSKTLQKTTTCFDWLLTAAKEAQGRLELASLEYKNQVKLLINNDSTDSPSSLIFLRYQNEKLFDSYFQLHDWKNYLEWYEEYKLMSNDNINKNLEISIDVNFIKCLNSFETLNNNELTKVNLKECTNFKSLDDLCASFSSKYNTDEIERATYKEIYKNIINKRYLSFF